MKNNKILIRHTRLSISRPAAHVLRLGLPIIVAELIGFTLLFLRDRAKDAVYALYRYPSMLEYILLSLTLLVMGAFLFDYIARRDFSVDS